MPLESKNRLSLIFLFQGRRDCNMLHDHSSRMSQLICTSSSNLHKMGATNATNQIKTQRHTNCAFCPMYPHFPIIAVYRIGVYSPKDTMQHICTYTSNFSHGSFGGFNRKSIAYQAVNISVCIYDFCQFGSILCTPIYYKNKKWCNKNL